ncbi:MAG: hypothetical protein S4CHLAM37_04290 [Chlamydiia bacterium]|nr:hypothetical protein [Chlamydiia bacterium]
MFINLPAYKAGQQELITSFLSHVQRRDNEGVKSTLDPAVNTQAVTDFCKRTAIQGVKDVADRVQELFPSFECNPFSAKFEKGQVTLQQSHNGLITETAKMNFTFTGQGPLLRISSIFSLITTVRD